MTVRVYQVDAFTDRPFSGNQAAVCVLDGPAPEAWMQAVAAETNLPATSFVAPIPSGTDEEAEWSMRWFTPQREIVLCGHGTLATTHVLAHELGVEAPVFRYATVAGVLTGRSVDGGRIELDFPAYAPRPAPDDAGPAAAALFPDGSAPAVETLRGFEDLLVVVPEVADVLRLAVDPDAMTALPARCVIVSAAAGAGDDDDHDVVSRVFAHSVGIGEDAVTGSAHCLLGPYWAGRLGRPTLRARQASARGGTLEVDVRGERVALTGRATTVLRAELAPVAEPPAPPRPPENLGRQMVV
jgi:PhzF family phenazine biosynthesis protein